MQPVHGWIYSGNKYKEATTKQEQCKVHLISDCICRIYDKLQIEKMKKEYHEYCPKSKSNNIVFCPEKIIKRKKDKEVQRINDYFKNLVKKRRKKRTKKKGKETRSKQKKKKKGMKKKTKKKGKEKRSKQKKKKKGRKRKTKKKNKKKRRRKKERKSKLAIQSINVYYNVTPEDFPIRKG